MDANYHAFVHGRNHKEKTMKQKYERPNIKCVWLDERDIITSSLDIDEDETLVEGPIGGDGYDSDGWT